MSKGPHQLYPVQALEFVRQRHNLDLGDLDRVQRQRYFLTAAFRKIATARMLLDPNELGNLVAAIHKTVYVDADLKLLDLASQLSNLSANNIIGSTIPIAGRDPDSPVGDVLTVNPAQVRKFVLGIVAGRPSGGGSARSTPTATAGSSTATDAKAIDSGCIH